MANIDRGTKQQCPDCGTKFYDLNRTPITCVKCNTAFEPEPLLKPRRTREPSPPRKVVAPPAEDAAKKDDEPAADDAKAGAADSKDDKDKKPEEKKAK